MFFFNDTATTEIYTLSLHDALPILELGSASMAAFMVSAASCRARRRALRSLAASRAACSSSSSPWAPSRDRKSTRLNSSHANISYAVFCLKKKKQGKDTKHVNETYT